MKIDLIYVSWNRLEYVRHSFRALLANTAWDHVAKLVLADDFSTDGTREWLTDAARDVPVRVEWLPAPFLGPVAAGNSYLDRARSPETDAFAKIDNDFVVCPGWLPELLRLLEEHPEVDMLGIRPDIGPPQPCPYPERTISPPMGWIDGNGIWKHRAFDGRPRPVPGHSNGRFGMSEWMGNHPEVTKVWAQPDLPVFTLDGLPIPEWITLAREYEALGWQRGLPNTLYREDASAYWQWWLDEVEAVASRDAR